MSLIENTVLKLNKETVCKAAVTTSASETTVIDYTKKEDGKIVILLKSTSGDKTVKILKGNALQGTQDMAVTVAGGKESAIVVESGKFVNAFGTNKGKLILEGDAGVEVRVIELP